MRIILLGSKPVGQAADLQVDGEGLGHVASGALLAIVVSFARKVRLDFFNQVDCVHFLVLHFFFGLAPREFILAQTQ